MANDSNIVKDQLDRYRYARDNGHLKYLEKAKRCENFYAGAQWDDATRARLARLRRPALTLNKILPAIAAVQGEQINNRVDVAFRASATGDPETAAALDKLYLYIMNDNGYDDKESYLFDDGIISSRGFLDIRLNFDRNIRGEVDIEVANPMNIMLDPDAEEYDPAKWKELFYTKWMSLNDIKRLYGQQAYKDLKGRTKSDAGFGYDFIDGRTASFAGEYWREDEPEDQKAHRRRLRVVERQHKDIVWQEHFVDVVTGDTRPIPANWDRNRVAATLQMLDNVAVMKRQTECVYWTTTIDDVLIHNEKSPYRSFTLIPYFPFFRRGNTIGLVENMLDPQEFYNKVTSQELHIVNSSANGGWKVKRGSLTNMSPEDLEERGSETGLVLELEDVNDADKIQPNQVPTGLDRLVYIIGEDLKEVSMVSDSQRGFDRADVAAKAIQAKKASGAVNFAKSLSNLLITRRLVAKKVLELVQDYYTEERVYRVTGGGLMPQEEEVVINRMTPEGQIINDVTQGEYTIVVTAVPARNEFEDTQFEEALRLRTEAGVQIPDHVLVEHSHLNRKQELAEQIKQKSGWGDPNEMEMRAAELENQIKELEAQGKAAENKRVESETVLNMVRAQQAADEGEQGDESQAKMAELQAKQEEALMMAQLKKYEIDQNLRLKREEMAANLRLQREKMMGELAIRQQQAAAQAEVAKEAAKQKAAAQKPTEKGNGPQSE